MSKLTVHKGKRYRAAISLGLLKALAGKDMVAQQIADAGLPRSKSGVQVASARPKRFGRSMTQPRRSRVK